MKRIYHPFTKWECLRGGFFTPMKGKAQIEKAKKDYVRLLTDIPYFERTMKKVIQAWPNSCEHNLTNESMNRVAWLGQSSCAFEFGCCAEQTRSAFQLLTEDQQIAANAAADKVLQQWIIDEEERQNERHKAI